MSKLNFSQLKENSNYRTLPARAHTLMLAVLLCTKNGEGSIRDDTLMALTCIGSRVTLRKYRNKLVAVGLLTYDIKTRVEQRNEKGIVRKYTHYKISPEYVLTTQIDMTDSEAKCVTSNENRYDSSQPQIDMTATEAKGVRQRDNKGNILLHKQNNVLRPPKNDAVDPTVELPQPLNPLIGLWKEINPAGYRKFFANKTQRQAVEDMVSLLGVEKYTRVVGMLPIINKQPYAPNITTPLQLQQDYQKLENFLFKFANQKGGENKHGTVDVSGLFKR